MGLNLQNQALTFPPNTEFPGTMQLLLNLIAQYMAIAGEENFSGINFGPTTPAPDAQDRPWFKTDDSGNPIGWFSWDGSAWEAIPITPQTGGTGDRPASGIVGQQFMDTDISQLLWWNGTAWITVDGGPLEIRYVGGTDIGTILTNYPGWTQVTSFAACVIGIAGDGTGLGFSVRTPGQLVGEETHTQTIPELAEHVHVAPHGQGSATANGATGPGGNLSAYSNSGETDPTGNSTPFNVMQPTVFLYCIQKTG